MVVRVEVREGEHIGQALKKLKKLLTHKGRICFLRRRYWEYIKPGQVRRLKKGKAKMTARRQAYKRRLELGVE
jgi:ribosomal protein S21